MVGRKPGQKQDEIDLKKKKQQQQRNHEGKE